mgnify:CR=1 FL=1
MTALGILLLLAALYVLQVVLYDRLWGKGLEVKTSFQEEYATEDDTAALTEVVVNDKFLPLPVVEIDFHMGKGLRFTDEANTAVSDYTYRRDVFALGPRQKITRTLEFRCARRGYYRIDQAGLDVRSLLLTKKYVGSTPQATDFYVLPRLVSTQRIQIPFSQIMGNLTSRKKVYDDPFAFAGLRGYVRGDPMKYINWKATAKTGQLLVNLHESTLSQKVAVVLDLEGLGVQQADLLNEEAVRIARLARELGCGDFVKIEIMRDSKYLLPDNQETIRATETLAKEGFVVMPYMYPDLNTARDLVNAGAAAVMPLASPIGSNKGLATKDFIQILIDEIDLPVIVDAGIGRPSQACEAMEMGAAAIMANTALATAGDLPLMASAFRKAIEAGRQAYLSGLGRVLVRGAAASDPLTGFLRD